MSTDLNVISENLTELLQNSINMTSVFYDIFLNPEPMDVELKQFAYKNSSCCVYELIGSVISAEAENKLITVSGNKVPTVGSIIIVKDTNAIDGLYTVSTVSASSNTVEIGVVQPVLTDYEPQDPGGTVGLELGQIRRTTSSTSTIEAMGSLIPDVGSSIFTKGLSTDGTYTVGSTYITNNLITIVVSGGELPDFVNPVEYLPRIIPNRAKDRKIALDGEGSPEGVISANVGACYVDNLNQVVYFKADNSGENTGWTSVLTQTGVNLAIQTYLANGHYVTTSYLDDNDYTTETDVVAKIDEKFAAWSPTIVMSDVTGQTAIDLTDHDNQGIYLTASEDVTFTLPIVVDLNILHKIFVQLNLTAGVTVNLGTTHFFENIEPTFVNAGMYNIIFEFDNAAGVWVAGATYKGQVSS